MYNNNLNELQKSKIYFQLNVQDLVFQIYIETFRYMFERKTLVSIILSVTLIIFSTVLKLQYTWSRQPDEIWNV